MGEIKERKVIDENGKVKSHEVEITLDANNYRKHDERNLNNNAEVWRDIVGYEGLYQVSNFGRVKSLKRKYINQYGEFGEKEEFIKKQKLSAFDKSQKDTKGYFVVSLANNDRGKWVRVHRLVATAFLPNPHNLPEVNHKDGNKQNNNVDNLEWVTRSQNNLHAWRTGLRAKGETERVKKIKEHTLGLKNISKEMVLDIFKNCKSGIKGLSARAFANKYGISVQTVCNIKDLKNETYRRIVFGGI